MVSQAQVKAGIRALVAAGDVGPHGELGTVRELAGRLAGDDNQVRTALYDLVRLGELQETGRGHVATGTAEGPSSG